MANITTERVKNGVRIALENLAKGWSVRRATKEAGISVTSLYHKTTPKQRDEAMARFSGQAPLPKPAKEPGSTSKVIRRPSVNIPAGQDPVEYLMNRVAKLEAKILENILEEDK